MAHKKPTQKELLELGKKLEEFYNLGYINKKRAISYVFFKGIAYGAGIFLGGTVVIALLAWILSLFHQVPLVNELSNELKRSLENKTGR